eukprot:2776026-Amphidinium_carterae.1
MTQCVLQDGWLKVNFDTGAAASVMPKQWATAQDTLGPMIGTAKVPNGERRGTYRLRARGSFAKGQSRVRQN